VGGQDPGAIQQEPFRWDDASVNQELDKDVRIAAARIDEFAARMDLARSGLYPGLGCDGQAHARHGRSATDAHGRERGLHGAIPASETRRGIGPKITTGDDFVAMR